MYIHSFADSVLLINYGGMCPFCDYHPVSYVIWINDMCLWQLLLTSEMEYYLPDRLVN